MNADKNHLIFVFLTAQDFHEMSHGLLLWLENIDRRRNEIVPIDHTQDSDTLQEHHKTLLVNDFSFLFVQHIWATTFYACFD